MSSILAGGDEEEQGGERVRKTASRAGFLNRMGGDESSQEREKSGKKNRIGRQSNLLSDANGPNRKLSVERLRTHMNHATKRIFREGGSSQGNKDNWIVCKNGTMQQACQKNKGK